MKSEVPALWETSPEEPAPSSQLVPTTVHPHGIGVCRVVGAGGGEETHPRPWGWGMQITEGAVIGLESKMEPVTESWNTWFTIFISPVIINVQVYEMRA